MYLNMTALTERKSSISWNVFNAFFFFFKRKWDFLKEFESYDSLGK